MSLPKHVRTYFEPPTPPTKIEILVSAAHWQKLAEEEIAKAQWEIDQGLPRGDVSSYYRRATLYQEVADEMKAQAERMSLDV
jgi:hypothetical protein